GRDTGPLISPASKLSGAQGGDKVVWCSCCGLHVYRCRCYLFSFIQFYSELAKGVSTHAVGALCLPPRSLTGPSLPRARPPRAQCLSKLSRSDYQLYCFSTDRIQDPGDY